MTTLEEHLKKKFDTIAGFDKEIDVYELKELLSRMAVGADGYLSKIQREMFTFNVFLVFLIH